MRLKWWLGILGTIVALAIVLVAVPGRSAIDPSDCSYDGIPLYGKVEFVDSFPDLEIKFVDSFPDLKVEFVDSFPDRCGEWKIVESFPDFTIKPVESFPDVEIEIVDSFPGLP